MMSVSFVPSHIGPGPYPTGFGYLVLVVLHLLAFGGVGLLVTRMLGGFGASRSRLRGP